MALRVTSHGDLQAFSSSGKPSLDSGLYKSFSLSSSNVSGGSRFGRGGMEELREFSKPLRRPVRAVRPVSAALSGGGGGGGSFLQVNHLQGELVRKRKECEDLKKDNKYLSNEIHMERIMMRTESELTMRNLRNLNQELLGQVKELKQKLLQSQQRATVSARHADQAEASRGEAEKHRVLAEARTMSCRSDKEQLEVDRGQLSDELQNLKKKHTDVQLILAETERKYYETKVKLDRTSAEKNAFSEENRSLENERDTLRLKLRQITEENVKIRDKEVNTRHRAMAAEEKSHVATQAQKEADLERRLAEREREERTAECLSWREKHRVLEDVFRGQEELKSLRQNKACQASIKSYFLCMTESDQRVKILKNQDGTPRNFTEGDPVYISTPEPGSEDADRTSSRSMLRVSAPHIGKDQGPSHFGDLPAVGERGERPDSAPPRRSRKVVEYFWIPTDEE